MKLLSRQLCCFLFILLSFSRIFGQKNAIDHILKHPDFKHVQLGVSVLDINSDELIISHNHDISLIPASSLKLLTTFSALSLLGSNYEYMTTMYSDGEISTDGTLYGDLVIFGSGDPSFVPPDKDVDRIKLLVQDLARAVIKAGIRCIDGNLIIDASIFERFGISDSWSWDDITNYYASGSYGLNIHENLYYIFFEGNRKEGGKTKINNIFPIQTQMKFNNEVISGAVGSRDNAYLYGDPYNYERDVRGSIPPGNKPFTIKGAIVNPPNLLLMRLVEELKKNGVGVSSGRISYEKIILNSEAKLLWDNVSAQLIDLARKANHESNNLYCESMLKSIGAINNSASSFDDGIENILSYLSEIDMDYSALNMYDGSGLSVRNRISPYFLTEFLNKIVDSEGIEYVLDLIPQTGKNGSVINFLNNKDSQGFVWLKSGSMTSVLSYTGIINTKSGKWFSICLISNGHSVKNSIIRTHFENMISSIYNDN